MSNAFAEWGLGIQVLEAIDETYLVGFAQVYDLVYSWSNGAWSVTTTSVPGGGSKTMPLYDLDKQPYIERLPGYSIVLRYYWGVKGHWVFFGTNQNY